MSIQFTPATKKASKARIALCGPSGSGKTYTGLALATALSDRVAVIDTERGSASKYVGLNGWQFDTVTPDKFSPLSLVETLGVAAGAGYGVALIDSLSHYWMGADGMLEQVDRRARNGNNFSGWKEARPDERKMIDALLSFPGHVIVTMRSKTEYVIEENDRGKKAPRKVGTKPEQRDGIEYEFDVIGDLDLDNRLSISKTRISSLAGETFLHPGVELARTIADWLADGVEVPSIGEYRDRAAGADSRDALLEILREVEAAQLSNAPTVDEEGRPTVLRDFIVARGQALGGAS
ncbi:ATP-binding protein [Prescottella equi]|uniref:ATP-binding protein n=1 Tax=Rhodococcus hoagii TaxID=43767 RepID=UPI001A0D9C20|nr:ATP-binding protein [Prescottella equi]NKW26805.1 AAA family ATPase [Prescottella equi]NKW33730.1 AAA family ATPase [Prescottella equi]UPH36710.1 ATP-binding protein [Prescottella equi]UPH40839.1 ATP-binding protein [Prescottella equi]